MFDIRELKSILQHKADVYGELSQTLGEGSHKLNSEQTNAVNHCLAERIIEESKMIAFSMTIGDKQGKEYGMDRLVDMMKWDK